MTNEQRRRHRQYVLSELVGYEARVRADPNASRSAYWFFLYPPKDKLPQVGETWIWSYTWDNGYVEERAYKVLKTKGYGGKYPRFSYVTEDSTYGEFAFKELSGGGEWRLEEDDDENS